MNVDEYLARGKQLFEQGYESDGCSFVGWIVHPLYPQLEQACRSHDFARRNLIPVTDQRENDNLFKDSLKYLNAPQPLRFIMYTFTRLQGYMKDRFGMTLDTFLFMLFLIAFMTVIGIGVARADSITFTPPTEREDGSQLLPSEIGSYNVYDLGNPSTPELTLPGTATSFDLTPGSADRSFVITTKDTDGRESTYSQSFTIPKLTTRPKPPMNIRVTPSGR